MKKLIITIIITLFIFNTFFVVSAETITELKIRIEETNNQIRLLDKEIKQYQSQIATTSDQARTLANLIKEITLTRSKLIKEKEQTENKISATNFAILELLGGITKQQRNIDNSREYLIKMIQEMNQQDQKILLEKILSQNSLANMSREYNNIVSINENMRQYIIDLEIQKKALSISKEKKELEQEKLSSLKQTLSQKEQAVLATQKEKNKVLTETRNQESEYKKLLAAREKIRDAFEKQLADYEDRLEFILNPSLLPKEGSLALSWPLENIYITQLFGITSDSKRLYTSGSHSGLDLRASIGTPVMAMASGTVVDVGDTDMYCPRASFGKWVFIKYNNGLSSTFGHLSVIYAKAGQVVKAGDIVGLSGNTGHTTGPHLHVTVYASQGAEVKSLPSLGCSGKSFIMPLAPSKSYLNPLLYLPKVTDSMIKK